MRAHRVGFGESRLAMHRPKEDGLMIRVPAKRSRTRRAVPSFLAFSFVLLTILGCSAAKELLALRRVEFRFAGLSGARVAGIPLRSLRTYSDLSPVDLGRLGVAIAREDVP